MHKLYTLTIALAEWASRSKKNKKDLHTYVLSFLQFVKKILLFKIVFSLLKENFQEYVSLQFLVGEAKRDMRAVYYKFFKSYLKRRMYSLFENDFSFKMVPNECTEIDRNTQTDLFWNTSEAEERSRGENPWWSRCKRNTKRHKVITDTVNWFTASFQTTQCSGKVPTTKFSLGQINLRNCVKLIWQ